MLLSLCSATGFPKYGGNYHAMSPPVLRRTCSEFAAQSVRLSNVELLRVPSRGTVVQELLQEYGLEPSFPSEVEIEAQDLASAPRSGIDDPSLEDRTSWPYVTIDGPYTRDLDQAIFIKRVGEGYLVSYALADGCFYMPQRSLLFKQALEQRGGSSFYLPRCCVPMLPRVLSEDAMSLNERVVRRALCMEMELDSHGKVTCTKAVRGKIYSHAKLTFQGVENFLEGKPPECHDFLHQPFAETLQLLQKVGNLRRALARERNVVEYKRHRNDVSINDDGSIMVLREEQLRTELYNEQISLMVNIEGAELLKRYSSEAQNLKIEPIFRAQNAPTEKTLDCLTTFIDDLIRVHGLDPSLWRWSRDGTESLAAYLKRLWYFTEEDPDMHCVFMAVNRRAMMSNKPAKFQAELGLHESLQAIYARFSSPMRELVGCFTHCELGQAMGWIPAADDSALRARVIQVGNEAKTRQKKISRDLEEVALRSLCVPELRKPRSERPLWIGVILGVGAKKQGQHAYVELADPPMEVKVYLRLRGCPQQYKVKEGVTLVPADIDARSWRVGERVGLRVTKMLPPKDVAKGVEDETSPKPQKGAKFLFEFVEPAPAARYAEQSHKMWAEVHLGSGAGLL
ncbi:rnr [Symbiodinium sp. CCMP2592]|nr:rnr [Symbiodinium sp. CCMP2592]